MQFRVAKKKFEEFQGARICFSIIQNLPDLNDPNTNINPDIEHRHFLDLHHKCNDGQKEIVDEIINTVIQIALTDLAHISLMRQEDVERHFF